MACQHQTTSYLVHISSFASRQVERNGNQIVPPAHLKATLPPSPVNQARKEHWESPGVDLFHNPQPSATVTDSLVEREVPFASGIAQMQFCFWPIRSV